MKSMMKTAVVAAVAAVFVASVAIAQGVGQGGQGFGPGAGQGRGRGPGIGAPGGPGGRGMMPGLMRDLTDQQREQVRAILQEQKPEERGAGPKLHQALQAELLADTPHDGRIEELKQQILQQHAENLTRQIETQKRISQVLTPEQRAKARERVAQGPQRPRRR